MRDLKIFVIVLTIQAKRTNCISNIQTKWRSMSASPCICRYLRVSKSLILHACDGPYHLIYNWGGEINIIIDNGWSKSPTTISNTTKGKWSAWNRTSAFCRKNSIGSGWNWGLQKIIKLSIGFSSKIMKSTFRGQK
jgi:hypothetical protein